MPMPFIRRAPDHVARPNFHFWSALALHPPAPGRDDQGLPEWMGMPGRPSAGFERDNRATRARRLGSLKQWVNAYIAGKILVRPFTGRLRAISFNIHFRIPLLDCLLNLGAQFF